MKERQTMERKTSLPRKIVKTKPSYKRVKRRKQLVWITCYHLRKVVPVTFCYENGVGTLVVMVEEYGLLVDQWSGAFNERSALSFAKAGYRQRFGKWVKHVKGVWKHAPVE